MNYIIDPKMVYLINTMDSIKIVISIIAFFLCATVIYHLIYREDYIKDCADCYKDLERYQQQMDLEKEYNFKCMGEEYYQEKINSKKEEIKYYEKRKKLLKYEILIVVISVLMVMFIPTTQTMFEMYVAKFATTDALNLGAEGLKNFIQEIVNIVRNTTL